MCLEVIGFLLYVSTSCLWVFGCVWYAEWSSIFVQFLINNVRIYDSGVVLYVRQIYVRDSGVSV